MDSDPTLSSARQTIRDCLKEATAQCVETLAKLSAECSKWLTAKMNTEDSAAVRELIEKAKGHQENLAEWTSPARPSKLKP